MKKVLSLILALVIVFSLSACGQKEEAVEPEVKEPTTEEVQHSACLITSTPKGNAFIDRVWMGFETLEKEGWQVKCIEAFETAEHAEQIRSACEEGYNIIYTIGDDVMTSVKELGDELSEAYPDTQFYFLDTYTPTEMKNSCAVTVDPFESCFVAGYVAAKTTKTGEIGLVMPQDHPMMLRFEYGYYAGIDYANTGAKVIKTYTNDWMDTTKGYEATKALANSNDVDVIIHCASMSGYGAIQACADMKIPCIGVDDWQGSIDPIVFWSAIKAMNAAVTTSAHMWENGEEIPKALEIDLNNGGEAYADVDLENLSDELAEEVKTLVDDIISGNVDVFANGYEEWRVTAVE